MEFRSLRADEIECRIGQVAKNGSGLSLLLFKTARVDADILDETVGPENWQCEFYEQKGTLFCKVGILVTREVDGTPMNGVRVVNGTTDWVWKSDAGSPSNMEAEKGEASDAFKRACFKWSLGRELYTTPRIWVYAQNRDGSVNCNIKQGQNGKFQCYDSFSVERIDIRDHEILYVAVRNDTTGRTVFAWAKPEYEDSPSQANEPSREQLAELSGLVEQLAKERGVDNDKVIGGLMESKAMKAAGVTNGEIKTARQAATAIGQMRTWTRSGEKNA